MGHHGGKGHQANKHSKNGTCAKQFDRTVSKTGRWRGKLASAYKKYKKSKKKTYGVKAVETKGKRSS